jgi:type IV secretion system protein VirB4
VRRELITEFEKRYPVSSCVELFGYLDDTVIATYCGDCVVMLRLDGIDPECLGESDLDDLARAQGRLHRSPSDEYRLYEYMLRERHGDFYSTELYAALLKMASKAANGLEANGAAARSAADLLVEQGTKFGYSVLSGFDSFAVLQRLMLDASPRRKPVSPRQALDEALNGSLVIMQFLNEQIPCHDVERDKERNLLRFGEHLVRVLTLSEIGNETRPTMLEGLQSVEGEFIVCAEWKRIPEGKSIIDKCRDVTNQFKGQASVSWGGKNGQPQEKLNDEADVHDVATLGDAQKRVRKGEHLGWYSLTVAVHALSLPELEKTQSAVERVFRETDCRLRVETYNSRAAYWAMIPGGYGYQFRRFKLLERNAADLGLWTATAMGQPFNIHLNGPSTLTVRTRQGTRFDANLHVGAPGQGVAHTFTLGATGSGKSVTNCLLLDEMKGKYSPYVSIFDKGQSYRWLTQAHEGRYYRVSPTDMDDSCTINPFGCEKTDSNLSFLKLLARVLMEQNAVRLSADELEKVHQRIEDMFLLTIPASERRLSLLSILLGPLGKRLKRWLSGGEYGWVFDNEQDTLSLSDWQCFEFQGADPTNKTAVEVLEPLVLLFMHRVTEPLYDERQISRLKVYLFGELWSFFRNPAIEGFVERLARTARKNNGILMMETQSPDEITRSNLAHVILDACKTRLYLTTKIDEEQGKLLQLSVKKREIIRDLAMGEVLLDQPDAGMSKVLKIELTDRMKALASNDPLMNAKRNKAIERLGNEVESWLPELIAANGGG